jgi:hypothetical protein
LVGNAEDYNQGKQGPSVHEPTRCHIGFCVRQRQSTAARCITLTDNMWSMITFESSKKEELQDCVFPNPKKSIDIRQEGS